MIETFGQTLLNPNQAWSIVTVFALTYGLGFASFLLYRISGLKALSLLFSGSPVLAWFNNSTTTFVWGWYPNFQHRFHFRKFSRLSAFQELRDYSILPESAGRWKFMMSIPVLLLFGVHLAAVGTASNDGFAANLTAIWSHVTSIAKYAFFIIDGEQLQTHWIAVSAGKASLSFHLSIWSALWIVLNLFPSGSIYRVLFQKPAMLNQDSKMRTLETALVILMILTMLVTGIRGLLHFNSWADLGLIIAVVGGLSLAISFTGIIVSRAMLGAANPKTPPLPLAVSKVAEALDVMQRKEGASTDIDGISDELRPLLLPSWKKQHKVDFKTVVNREQFWEYDISKVELPFVEVKIKHERDHQSWDKTLLFKVQMEKGNAFLAPYTLSNNLIELAHNIQVHTDNTQLVFYGFEEEDASINAQTLRFPCKHLDGHLDVVADTIPIEQSIPVLFRKLSELKPTLDEHKQQEIDRVLQWYDDHSPKVAAFALVRKDG